MVSKKMVIKSGSVALFVALGAASIPSVSLAESVCHISKNVKQLDVGGKAVIAHLGHGDHLPNIYFADFDEDSYGDIDNSIESCILDAEDVDGYVDNSDDLDDTDASVLDRDYDDVGTDSGDIEGEPDVEE